MQTIKIIRQPIIRNITGTIIVRMDIPGYEGLYRANSNGQIISLLGKRPKILNPGKNEKGYLLVNLCKNKKKKSIKIHIIIALTFLGKRPDGLVINHIDGNKLNNKSSNLEYITPRENSTHYYKSQKKSSQYIGVHWVKQRKKWRARITINKKQYSLGSFQLEIEAHNAYQNALNTHNNSNY